MRQSLALLVVLLLAACANGAATVTPTPGLPPAQAATALAPDTESAETATNPAPSPTPDVAALSATSTPEPPAQGITVPADYTISPAIEGLQGPTQMLNAPDGRLWVAHLNREENAGTGQLLALSLVDGSREVLLDGLLKPTGIALLGDALWIASGRDLLRAPLNESGLPAAPKVVLDELPFNGRSNGTLTATPSGTLLFETSGARDGNQAAEGSATLWELDPADPANPRPLATGLKGAYAHTVDFAGNVWTTEIGDDPVNGGPPPDELNLVVEGANFGWPQCFGARQPAENYGGTAEACAATRAPVVLFGPQTTPTSIVPSAWEADTLYVALWGPTDPMVARVRFTMEGDNATASAEPFITGLQNPQSLLLANDGSLLVSDFTTGTIYRVDRARGP
jgi:glucose/arabinose dehydrogenase